MLPDFPKIRRELLAQQALHLQLKTQYLSPLTGIATRITQHEGSLHSFEQDTGREVREVTQAFEEIVTPVVVPFNEVPTLVGPAVIARLNAIAEDRAAQMSKLGFKKLDEGIREAGTGVSANGRPLTQELFLQGMEKIEMSFDPKTGSPDLVFIAHPTMADHMHKSWQEWETDTEFMKRYRSLLERKRGDWRDRESRRKLVD